MLENKLFIKNLKVEEGFFNNLNLDFSKGLNVLIGGRGVGKTSIIELIRFGLGAGNLSPANSNDSSSHALSILQSSGRVTLELETNGQSFTVSRSALDDYPMSTGSFIPPIVFSQKEIETISLNADGRLSLIDSFIPDVQRSYDKLLASGSELRSNSALFIQLKKELSELTDKTTLLPSIKDREKFLESQQSAFQQQNQQIKNNQNVLNIVQNHIATISVDLQSAFSIKQSFEYKLNQLQNLAAKQGLPTLNSPEASPLNDFITTTINNDIAILESSINTNKNAINEVNKYINILNHKKIELEENSRQNRSEVEKYTEGAGAILSELGRVKEQIAQLENYNNIANQKRHEIKSIYDKCQANLEVISQLKEELLNKRKFIVGELNQHLSPTICTSILPLSNLAPYATALENILRGSGLKYKELIPTIVEKISPSWLLYYAYSLKYDDFAQSISIPLDRATRLLGYLSEVDLGSVLTSKIEDKIDFTLLDHGSYKHVEELSIGQRCTVALSVILENPNRVLVIDQPEDHLDNEFIAQTLIRSIVQRAEKAQTILSSHNANIPVLGNASNIVNLDSNGRKGFIKSQGPIDAREIKNIIESIMEGGKQAFNTRAHFYKG